MKVQIFFEPHKSVNMPNFVLLQTGIGLIHPGIPSMRSHKSRANDHFRPKKGSILEGFWAKLTKILKFLKIIFTKIVKLS